MSLDAVLPLFEELEQQARDAAAAANAARERQWAWMREPRHCKHCGEWAQNTYLWEINHRDGFWDGWCIQHRSKFAEARWPWGKSARAWLTERGFALPTVEQRWGDWGDE